MIEWRLHRFYVIYWFLNQDRISKCNYPEKKTFNHERE